MNKILSVVIPSYNMEEYLYRNVSSMMIGEILDDLEIIIVNDGSKDRTSEIAHELQRKASQSIVVIDKENGHYGSCVNAALKIATGKYFRILDADDWMDSGEFVKFVNILKCIDVDCIYTPFANVFFNKNRKEYCIADNAVWNKKIDLSHVSLPPS